MALADNLDRLISSIFQDQSLISASFGSPRSAHASSKITIRPVLIKGQVHYQITEMKGTQAWHRNMTSTECHAMMEDWLSSFKQVFFYTHEADFQVLINKKLQPTILKKRPSKSSLPISHNRQKHYLLSEGVPIPFLIELGVMSSEGKVYPKKQDKFRQINRFLEMIDDVLPHLPIGNPLHIVDFGCGKAYLTFALYHYLKLVKGYDLRLVGIDLKQDVIENCQDLAKKLGYQDLIFHCGSIEDYVNRMPVEMVVSLHACDTATDAALEKAIQWQAKVILCVPCCQHELFGQIKNEELAPLLKHGIFKERLAALVTDAARAQLLEVLGYHTQVLEFIDVEHTPKNLLIRAIKHPKGKFSKDAWHSYQTFKQVFDIYPSLEKRFDQDFNQE